MKKLAEVVMLPTQKAIRKGQILTSPEYGMYLVSDNKYLDPNWLLVPYVELTNGLERVDVGDLRLFTLNHLYIVIEENIKKGDWYYYLDQIHKCKEIKNGWIICEGSPHFTCLITDGKKVIATTDPEVNHAYMVGNELMTDPYPRPSMEFLQAFVTSHNLKSQKHKEPIKLVNVDFKEIVINSKTGEEITYFGYETDILIEDGTLTIEKMYHPKVASDNTITISKYVNEEKTYTESEVRDLMRKSFKSGFETNKRMYFSDNGLERFITEYIDENL